MDWTESNAGLKKMIRLTKIFSLLVFLLVLTEPLYARPEFLARFQSDPFRRPEVDGCNTCHVNPRGGGPRNEFGAAFQAADHVITPMLRASFPDKFKFETAKLANGATFYFSDPESKFVVFERENQKVLIDLTTISVASKTEKDVIPPPENRMSFFVASKGLGKGGHLEGLAGADRQCQALAEAVGAGDRTWRAYLSTSFQGQPAVNAGDRIGSGPWYNAKGMLIARGVADLHSAGRINKDTALTEKGEKISAAAHEILTGSLPNGSAAVDMNCNNWTSSNEGKALVGHVDRQGEGENGTSWNSARPANGCSQESLRATGGEGLFYCFAVK